MIKGVSLLYLWVKGHFYFLQKIFDLYEQNPSLVFLSPCGVKSLEAMLGEVANWEGSKREAGIDVHGCASKAASVAEREERLERKKKA